MTSWAWALLVSAALLLAYKAGHWLGVEHLKREAQKLQAMPPDMESEPLIDTERRELETLRKERKQWLDKAREDGETISQLQRKCERLQKAGQ